jgi:hypothetical protein
MVDSPNRPTDAQINLARRQWQEELIREEEATAQRLLTAYERLLRKGSPIDKAMGALIDRIIQAEEPSPQDIQDLTEFQGLLSTIRQDMNGFRAIYANEASELVESAVLKGDASALAMTQANVPLASGEIALGWNQPNPQALADLVSIIDNETWRNRQASFGDASAEKISDMILGFVGQGKNPRFIARAINDALLIPYSWADNTVRTAQIYSYRRSSHLSYASNAQFLDGWVWQSALDNRTCLSCISQHGMLYPLDKILNDHHRGRCTPLPKVKGTTWHDSMTTGEDWFFSLTPEEQTLYRANIRNNALFDAVVAKDVPFDKLSQPYQDDIYGEMLRQTTYREAIR